jgi:hypothetical protein
MTPLETLKRARAHLSDPKNWNQDGEYFKGGDNATGCCCAMGAIILDDVGPVLNWSAPHVRAAQAALICALPSGWFSVPKYNDDPNTTHPDILALYDRAIASLEGEA